jgi:hypothetical protein
MRFSPNTLSVLEFKSKRDVEICEKIYADHPLLGDKLEGTWNVRFAQEFNMTSDSRLFLPRPEWERKGYRPDAYGRWESPNGDIALPLYEGRMIGQFDFSQKGWVSGKGRGAVWRDIPWDQKDLSPQYLMSREEFVGRERAFKSLKATYMRIGSATNTRTMFSTVVQAVPCGDTAPVIVPTEPIEALYLCAVFNSFVFDWVIRKRCGGLHLDFHYIEPTPVPRGVLASVRRFMILGCASLSCVHQLFAPVWLRLAQEFVDLRSLSWQAHWSVTRYERLRLRCMLDAMVAELYGLTGEDLEHVLQPDESDLTGFWRVDQELPVEQRLTSLTMRAFEHLKQVGLEEFCRLGWGLPEYARAFDRPGVKSWTPTEDWSDCKRHARNILGEDGFTRFMASLSGQESEQTAKPAAHVAEPSPAYGPGAQRRLFPGDPTLFGDPMEDPAPRRRKN